MIERLTQNSNSNQNKKGKLTLQWRDNTTIIITKKRAIHSSPLPNMIISSLSSSLPITTNDNDNDGNNNYECKRKYNHRQHRHQCFSSSVFKKYTTLDQQQNVCNITREKKSNMDTTTMSCSFSRRRRIYYSSGRQRLICYFISILLYCLLSLPWHQVTLLSAPFLLSYFGKTDTRNHHDLYSGSSKTAINFFFSFSSFFPTTGTSSNFNSFLHVNSQLIHNDDEFDLVAQKEANKRWKDEMNAKRKARKKMKEKVGNKDYHKQALYEKQERERRIQREKNMQNEDHEKYKKETRTKTGLASGNKRLDQVLEENHGINNPLDTSIPRFAKDYDKEIHSQENYDHRFAKYKIKNTRYDDIASAPDIDLAFYDAKGKDNKIAAMKEYETNILSASGSGFDNDLQPLPSNDPEILARGYLEKQNRRLLKSTGPKKGGPSTDFDFNFNDITSSISSSSSSSFTPHSKMAYYDKYPGIEEYNGTVIHNSRIEFYPNKQRVPVQISLFLQLDLNTSYYNTFDIAMPRFTSGNCDGKSGHDITGLRLTPSRFYRADWIEGDFNQGGLHNRAGGQEPYQNSKLRLYFRDHTYHNNSGDGKINIKIDSSNGIKAFCGFEDNWQKFIISVNRTDTQFGKNASIEHPIQVVDRMGLGCSSLLHSCSGHGSCDYCYQKCTCEDGWGSDTDLEMTIPSSKDGRAQLTLSGRDGMLLDCSQRTCPKGPAWAAIPTDNDTAHYYVECSNQGVCDRETGSCKCSGGGEEGTNIGEACQKRHVCGVTDNQGNRCSGHGQCLEMSTLARLGNAIPLSPVTTYGNPPKRELNDVLENFQGGGNNGEAWDSESLMGCLCDSGWEVGLGAGQTQLPEYFGPDCSLRRCPSGDDPETPKVNETNCEGVTAEGGHGVGAAGNLCHVDCSNRGVCDYLTGTCTCFENYYGDNCGRKYTHLVLTTEVEDGTAVFG